MRCEDMRMSSSTYRIGTVENRIGPQVDKSQ